MLSRRTRCVLVFILIVSQIILAALAAVRPVRAAAQASGPADPEEVGAFLDGAFAAQMADAHVVGAVVAVVKDGQVLYTRGYGYADLAQNMPVDPQMTLFRPGSISKLFTFTAVMQLVEQGKLSLDEDVNTYLDFTIPATYPEPITLRHLLTHTPGFEDSGEGLFVLDEKDLLPLDVFLKERIPARVYPPGTVSAYSNYGAALAGYIVERVSAMPFYQYTQQNILQPLSMTRTTFVQPLPAELARDMSRGYNYTGGEYLEGGFEIVSAYPAGSLSATADDLTRFMIAHLQDGRYQDAQILSQETARQMHSPLFSQDPRLDGMAYGFFEHEVNGQQVISHGGDTILFHSGLYLIPDQNLGIFISTNSTTGGDVVQGVFQAFMDRYFPVSRRAETAPPADFAARAGLYAGEYYMSRNNFTTVEKLFRVFSPFTVSPTPGGEVLLSFPGQGVIRYREIEPGYLLAEEGSMPALVLQQDPSGQVSLLTSSPWKLVKTPWYATSTLQLILFIGGFLLFLVTLIVWTFGGIAGLLRRRPQKPGARLARITAGLFMLLFIITLAGVLSVLADIDPAYGQPRMFFQTTSPRLDFLISLVPALAVLGALTLVFAVLAWIKRYWTARGRLFYTLLAAWFAVIIWGLVYWNVLG